MTGATVSLLYPSQEKPVRPALIRDTNYTEKHPRANTAKSTCKTKPTTTTKVNSGAWARGTGTMSHFKWVVGAPFLTLIGSTGQEPRSIRKTVYYSLFVKRRKIIKNKE